MITVVRQYKKNFVILLHQSFQLHEFQRVDENNDGRISFDEYQNMRPDVKDKFKNYLKLQGQWEAFNKARSIIYDRRLAESMWVTSAASSQEYEHSDKLEWWADIFIGRIIRPGQSGVRVRALQEALLPWFSNIEVNWTYDQNTTASVRWLQNYYNKNSWKAPISVDGVFGNEWRQALRWMQETHGQSSQQSPRWLVSFFKSTRNNRVEQAEAPEKPGYRWDFIYKWVLSVWNQRTRGDEIYNMQVALIKAGYWDIVGVPDWSWGNKTTRALAKIAQNIHWLDNKYQDWKTLNQTIFDALFYAAEWRKPNRITESSTNYSARSRARHNREVAMQREALSNKLISYPPADPQALQAYLQEKWFYTMKIDGLFGPGSIKALQQYLTSTGDYSGPIDGKFWPLTDNAIASYNSALQTKIDWWEMYRDVWSRTTELRVSNKVEAISAELDKLINVSILNSHIEWSTEWLRLVRSIAAMNLAWRFDAGVWNQFMRHIENNPNFANIRKQINNQRFLSRLSDLDKYMILTRIWENTMWGNNILRAIQSKDISEIKRLDEAQSARMLWVLAAESGVSQSLLAGARQNFLSWVSSYTRWNQFKSGEIFSARMRSEVNGIIQPMFPHEIISSNGRDYIELWQKSDKLVNKISHMYLQSLSDNIRRDYWVTISADRIRKALLKSPVTLSIGGATIDIDYHLGYFKSADCFNDAIGFMPDITIVKITKDWRARSPIDGPSTSPGEPDSGPGTAPGEGNNNAWGGNDSGRNDWWF